MAQPGTRQRPKPKPIVERTMVTRPANAGRNPAALEVPTSDEDETSKRKKRKKKTKKTQEEQDAVEESRAAAMLNVGNLEVAMFRQASINESTPRVLSTARATGSRLRSPSYVAPDPSSPPAPVSAERAVVSSVLSISDDEEEAKPPMKKVKAANIGRTPSYVAPDPSSPPAPAPVSTKRVIFPSSTPSTLEGDDEEEAGPPLKKAKPTSIGKKQPSHVRSAKPEQRCDHRKHTVSKL